jgi:hypothetical protein
VKLGTRHPARVTRGTAPPAPAAGSSESEPSPAAQKSSPSVVAHRRTRPPSDGDRVAGLGEPFAQSVRHPGHTGLPLVPWPHLEANVLRAPAVLSGSSMATAFSERAMQPRLNATSRQSTLQPRWALSYLRGPMTQRELRSTLAPPRALAAPPVGTPEVPTAA